MTQLASDRHGRRWALVSVGGVLWARLVHGFATPAVMGLAELVESYDPVVLSPTAESFGYAAFIDAVDLVAGDPATASVEQVGEIAAFALSIIEQARGPLP